MKLTGATVEELRREVERQLRRLVEGGLVLNGLRLDFARTAAPTTAPAPGDPNLLLVDVSGTVKLYLWSGAAWVVVGTQT